MDVTSKILGESSPYIKGMEFVSKKSEYVLELFNDPECQLDYSVLVFPCVSEYKIEQHSTVEQDCLDSILGIQEFDKHSYVITTQYCEVFLRCKRSVL
ncbi:MAG: hypothetical protein AB4057_10595 [Crocosphaera sp.]